MTPDPWRGLNPSAHQRIQIKNYEGTSILEQLSSSGVEWGALAFLDVNNPEVAAVWIPGVEIVPRKVWPQRHRGIFGEFGREDEGVFGKIKLWPKQWATARMNAGTAKGFHIHPPYLAEGIDPASHFHRQFVDEADNYSQRRYELEQWDAMFFVQGKAEMILVDERAGMPRKIMRFFIEGDNHRGPNNGGIIIPPGVAHAVRVEGSEDLIMVYGTSTVFLAENEGRIASDVELCPLPSDWHSYLLG